MNRLTSTEVVTVTANGRNHSPASPLMKATGTNTAMIENVVAVTASPISAVPLRAAVMRSSPRSRCRMMFSRTTMASSISTPIASDRPSSVMKFSVKPASHTAMKAAIAEVGSDRAVMSVERHELRKANTTSTVSPAPRISASITFMQVEVRLVAAVLRDHETGARRAAWPRSPSRSCAPRRRPRPCSRRASA